MKFTRTEHGIMDEKGTEILVASGLLKSKDKEAVLNLAAAAPDMYEALKEIHEYTKTHITVFARESWLMAHLLAALAKVEGK